jgi:hypothetical protein
LYTAKKVPLFFATVTAGFIRQAKIEGIGEIKNIFLFC